MNRTLALLLASAAFAYAALASAATIPDCSPYDEPAEESCEFDAVEWARLTTCVPGDAEYALCDAADLWSPEERALIEAGGAP